MKQLLFYEKPVALNREQHRAWRMDPACFTLSFARHTNSVIVTGAEFIHLAKEYPVVFARTGERITPLALLGLRNDENLFVDTTGQWDARYVPAFVRRYPFVLADEGSGRLTVCIDEGFAGFNTATGTPLFDEVGEQSPLLGKAIDFLKEFQGQHQRTELFVNRLQEMELLSEWTAQVEVANMGKIAMAGLQVVDEKKLLGLDQERTLTLFRSGELGWVYAHLLSLSNLGRLAERLARRGETETPKTLPVPPVEESRAVADTVVQTRKPRKRK
ncbi:MAG: SapC family protein [Magnetococcus sp. MYC-9]